MWLSVIASTLGHFLILYQWMGRTQSKAALLPVWEPDTYSLVSNTVISAVRFFLLIYRSFVSRLNTVCGDSLENGSVLAPAGGWQCDMTCSGNANEYCGGGDRIAIYNLTNPTAPTLTPAPDGWNLAGCYT